MDDSAITCDEIIESYNEDADETYNEIQRWKKSYSNKFSYFGEINKNKYLILVPANKRKEVMKKYEELRSKIRDLIRSITKNSDDYDEKFINIKTDLDDVNKTTEIYNVIIVVRAIFHENNKYYSEVFLDECLCKI